MRAGARTDGAALLRIQARGGGEGGVDGRADASPVVDGASSEVVGLNTRPAGVTGMPETPEHLSRHSANFAQSPLACLSQCCPCGQQSEGMTIEVPGE